MACSQNDFEEGGTIYVRGKKAICKGLDEYPLIFWAYEDNPTEEFHRSLKDDADMFSIHPPMDHKENESKLNPEIPSERNPLSEKEEKQINSENNVDSNASGPSVQKKGLYENIDDDIVTSDEKLEDVHIVNCTATTFTFQKNVNTIELCDCNDIVVNFTKSSHCKVIRTLNSALHCKDYCGSFLLDSCQKCEIEFPQGTTNSEIVNIEERWCKGGINLSAISMDPDSTNKKIKHVNEYTSKVCFETSFKNGIFSAKQSDEKNDENVTKVDGINAKSTNDSAPDSGTPLENAAFVNS